MHQVFHFLKKDSFTKRYARKRSISFWVSGSQFRKSIFCNSEKLEPSLNGFEFKDRDRFPGSNILAFLGTSDSPFGAPLSTLKFIIARPGEGGFVPSMAFPPLDAICFVTNTPEISSLHDDRGRKNFLSRPGHIAWEGSSHSDKSDGLVNRIQKAVPQETALTLAEQERAQKLLIGFSPTNTLRITKDARVLPQA